jgi:hypothetical protein
LGGRTPVVKRVEIAGYAVVAAALAFVTIAAAWSVFVTGDSAHHFNSSKTDPFITSFSFLFLLLVVADVLGLLWLIRRIRGRR